jgi:hypothetical protein
MLTLVAAEFVELTLAVKLPKVTSQIIIAPIRWLSVLFLQQLPLRPILLLPPIVPPRLPLHFRFAATAYLKPAKSAMMEILMEKTVVPVFVPLITAGIARENPVFVQPNVAMVWLPVLRAVTMVIIQAVMVVHLFAYLKLAIPV